MSNQNKFRYAISILFAVVTLLIVGIQLVGVSYAEQIPISFIGTIFYLAGIILIFVIYYLIKNKLRNLGLKPKTKRYIKYAYITLVIILTRVLALFAFGDFKNTVNLFESFSGEVLQINIYKQIIFAIYNLFNIFIPYEAISNVIVNIMLITGIALLIRKIVLKATRSPLTADIATILFVTYPKFLIMSTVINYEMFNLVIMLVVINLILNMLKLCKEAGYKKYNHLIYAIGIGALIGADLLIGGNILIWIIFLVIILFIINDVEIVHLKCPRKWIVKLEEKYKEIIYKIERINIRKSLVCVIVILLSACLSSLIYFGIYSGIKNINMFGYKPYAENFNLGSSRISLDINRIGIDDKDKFSVLKYLNKETLKYSKDINYNEFSNVAVNEAIKEYTNRSFLDNASFSYNKLAKILKNDIDMDSPVIYGLNHQNLVYKLAGTSNLINCIIYILLFITELANIFMARKKDEFTTVIKLAFLCNFIYILIFASAFYTPVYLQILSIMLLVLNVGNIYFNREDRIKMIASEN